MGGKILESSPDFQHDDTLYAGTADSTSGQLYRSTNGGDMWEEINGFGPYNFFHTIELSPDFGQDQTLIIGIDCRPLYISEDAGETWYELAGIREPCGYRSSVDVVIVHSGHLIQPVVSTGLQVFAYQWPEIEGLPKKGSVLCQSGECFT